MPEPMSAERLAEIRSLLPVTEHLWGAFRHLDSDCPGYTIETDDVVVAEVADYMVGELDGAYRVCVETERRYDAESIANFVAASPGIVRELLDEVERLTTAAVEPPAYVWSYQDQDADADDTTGPYAAEALARAEAEAEYVDARMDPTKVSALTWPAHGHNCHVPMDDGKSTGIHLWRSEVLGSRELSMAATVTTAEELRALPVGTVILESPDEDRSFSWVWQVFEDGGRKYAANAADSDTAWFLDQDTDVRVLLAYGPFRVLHTPGSDRG